MHILFICGSLESGKDGVGDYTLRLAEELRMNGHAISILALNDKYIDSIQFIIGNIPICRTPATYSWRKKTEIASQFIKSQAPEWLSLQYVPFAFHPKGLPFGLADRLRKIGNGRKWHILFHELWIGAQIGAPGKDKIIGQLQRCVIRYMLWRLQPHAVQVTFPLNKILLKGTYRGEVTILPIFSNIERVKGYSEEVSDLFPSDIVTARKDYFIAVIFGSYYAESWDLHSFIPRWKDYCDTIGKKPVLLSVGKLSVGASDWEKLEQDFPKEILFLKTGILPSRQISLVLQYFSDLGIITTPVLIIGKSGSYQAFREHGVPVMALENKIEMPFPLPAGMVEEDICIFKESDPCTSIDLLKMEKKAPLDQVPEVARLFLGSLKLQE